MNSKTICKNPLFPSVKEVLLHQILLQTKILDTTAVMKDTKEIIAYLRTNKKVLRDTFGVTRLGLFGSFVSHTQNISSDIDLVVEFEKGRKNIHAFLQLKRFLEKEFSRKVDLGFEHSLKPIVRENIKGKILYV